MTSPLGTVRAGSAAAAWLAAFALGLAYSQRPEAELLCELRAVAADRPWLLGDARRRLVDCQVAEPRICHEAVRLLELADLPTPVAC